MFMCPVSQSLSFDKLCSDQTSLNSGCHPLLYWFHYSELWSNMSVPKINLLKRKLPIYLKCIGHDCKPKCSRSIVNYSWKPIAKVAWLNNLFLSDNHHSGNSHLAPSSLCVRYQLDLNFFERKKNVLFGLYNIWAIF